MPRPIPYRIERTKNRYSRAVLRDETIVIRLARGLSTMEEREHVENLLRRMGKQVEREQARTLVDPFRPLLEGAQELTVRTASGQSYLFILSPGKRTKAKRTATGFHIQVGPGVRRRAFHRFLWKLLSDAERNHIWRLVDEINAETLRVRVDTVSLRYAVSQWGSCSRYARIMLNPVLLFVPPDLLTYVIVHELAHRVHLNHSRSFWKAVEHGYPQYQAARKRLRAFRICSL